MNIRKFLTARQSPDKVRRTQELRRSSASGPVQSKRRYVRRAKHRHRTDGE